MSFMKKNLIYKLINFFIAVVWLINGLFCKVLDLVPRHQEIVERILKLENARTLTVLIGFAETGMAVWILSGVWPRVNSVLQIIIIAAMNILEFFFAPDLLLWGKVNAIFAFLFILLIYFNEFYLNKKINQETACYHS
jgi:hypothetical protein